MECSAVSGPFGYKDTGCLKLFPLPQFLVIDVSITPHLYSLMPVKLMLNQQQ